ncbi:MAG: Rrf2 family transcriptional regulator [Candidatus Andersenbacteria bacterium]
MINLSRKSDYGFYLLTLLAEDGGALSLRQVAEQHDLSFQYLQEVAQTLRRAGFLSAARGARGGYRLSKPAGEVSALEVIAALEGAFFAETCMSSDGSYQCVRADRCRSKRGLSALKEKVLGVLATTSLADIVAENRPRPSTKLRQPALTGATR